MLLFYPLLSIRAGVSACNTQAVILLQIPVLQQYMIFVGYVREYLRKYPEKDLRKAINKAIDRCIREDVLREFLIRRRGEVTKVTQLDYTFDRRIELERKEAREEERVNTERERKRAEEERQRAEEERQAKELAEKEVQKLRAELEQYKRQFLKVGNQDFPG